MTKRPNFKKTTITTNSTVDGESIEKKVARVVSNKESVTTDGSPIIYTDRKDGVLPAYDVRADRFEIAVEAKDKIARSKIAAREARMHVVTDDKTEKKDGVAESIQGTESQGDNK